MASRDDSLNETEIERPRKDALQELEFQSFLLDSVSDSVMAYYLDEPDRGRLLYVNRAACAARGYTRDEMLQLNVRDLIAPEWRPRLEPRLERLERGEDVQGESSHLRKDGTAFPVEVWLRRVDFAGRPLIVNTARDITQRKQAEARRDAAERDLRESVGLGLVLDETNEMLLSSHDREEVFYKALKTATKAIGADYGVVSLKGEPDWCIAYSYNAPLKQGQIVPAARAKAAEAIVRDGEAFIAEDALNDERLDRAYIEELGVRAFIHVPLTAADRVTGILSFHNTDDARRFTRAQVSFAEHLASSVSLALENLRALQAERDARHLAREELEATQALLEAAHALRGWTDLKTLLAGLADVVLRATSHSRVTVLLFDERRTHASVEVSVGGDPLTAGMVISLDRASSAADDFLAGRRARVIDYESLPSGDRGAIAEEYGMRAVLLAPILSAERTLGAIAVDDPGLAAEFTDRDVRFTEGVAAQAAVAIENARLFEREHENALFGDALAVVDRAVHSSLEFAEVARQALAEGAKAIGAESGAIDGVEGDEWVVWYDYGFDSSVVGHRFTNDENRHGFLAITTGEPVAIDDAFTDPRVNNEVMRAYGLRSCIVAPLIVRDKAIAALYYNYNTDSHRFSDSEIQFVGKVASALSLATENARLYETERNIADRLQEALLALPDEVSGVEFAHAYHSATEEARVGGDFYDLFELNENHVGIVIGDVAGKGLDAAVLTSRVKNTIRAHAHERGKTPSEILGLTNDLIYSATSTESFVTVFFGTLDCRDGRLVFANAGHTTAALVRGDGAVAKLPVTGPLLGAFSSVRFNQSEACLDLGEALFLYTDGLTEARRDGEFYREERLFDFLVDFREGSPSDLVQAVIGDVMSFTRNRLSDDLAILALKRLERGATAPYQPKLEM